MEPEHFSLCVRMILVEAKDMGSNAGIRLACPDGWP